MGVGVTFAGKARLPFYPFLVLSSGWGGPFLLRPRAPPPPSKREEISDVLVRGSIIRTALGGEQNSGLPLVHEYGRNYNSPQLSTIIIAQQLKSMLQSKPEDLLPGPILLERKRNTGIQASVLTVIIIVVVIVPTTART